MGKIAVNPVPFPCHVKLVSLDSTLNEYVNPSGPLMSEPLSSTEIEDVLSSIRRLVSEDMRPQTRPVVLTSVVPPSGEKLILTPALRVVQDDVSNDLAYPPMFVATPRVVLSNRPVQPSGLELVVASVGAAVDAQAEEWEAEVEAGVADMGFGADDWSVPELHAEDDVVEPPTDETTAEEATILAASGADHFELLRTVTQQSPMPSWAQQDEAHDEDEAEEVTVRSGTIEPDPIWADAAEASVIAALAEDQKSQPDYLEQGQRFDEAVLRDLVREILREELAGTLGERITRNIRKLVRAEIARAMATQGFD